MVIDYSVFIDAQETMKAQWECVLYRAQTCRSPHQYEVSDTACAPNRGTSMHFKGRNKRNKNDLLIGGFDDYAEAQHAQRILKDFGYSENAVKVVESFHDAQRVRDAREIGQRIINRVMMICAILISIIFTTLACLFLRSIFSPLEIGMVFLVWITLMSGGVLICCFIGAVVWKLINSEAVDWGLEAVRRKKILIRVKLRNPDDAREIEQVWSEMGFVRLEAISKR